MDISVSDIVSEVKICIDEIGLNDAEFLGTQDNEEMDTIIKSKISEALRFVNGNADWPIGTEQDNNGRNHRGRSCRSCKLAGELLSDLLR